jgi:hypothetical protein
LLVIGRRRGPGVQASEASNGNIIAFFRSATNHNHGLSGVVMVVSGKIYLELPTHIPSFTHVSKMLGLEREKLFDFSSLGGNLFSRQPHGRRR